MPSHEPPTVFGIEGHPFVASAPGDPSYEAALGYFAIALALLLVGPGKLSLDAAIFGRGRTSKPDPPHV